MALGIEIIPLVSGHTVNLSDFDCGNEDLNVFLATRVDREVAKNISKAYVLKEKGRSKPLGFYTLSSASIQRIAMPSKTKQRAIPYQDVGVLCMGRLAIDTSVQGQGYGQLLIAHCMNQTFKASGIIGIYGLIVVAKDETAAKYYQKLDWTKLTTNSGLAYFVSTSEIKLALGL